MLNKTPFIIEELINRGLINAEKSSDVEAIINGDFQSQEYNLKKRIEEALTNEIYYYGLKSVVDLNDINELYDIITSKFKEDIKLTREDIRDQAKQFYTKKYRYKNNLNKPEIKSSLSNIYFRNIIGFDF